MLGCVRPVAEPPVPVCVDVQRGPGHTTRLFVIREAWGRGAVEGRAPGDGDNPEYSQALLSNAISPEGCVSVWCVCVYLHSVIVCVSV